MAFLSIYLPIYPSIYLSMLSVYKYTVCIYIYNYIHTYIYICKRANTAKSESGLLIPRQRQCRAVIAHLHDAKRQVKPQFLTSKLTLKTMPTSAAKACRGNPTTYELWPILSNKTLAVVSKRRVYGSYLCTWSPRTSPKEQPQASSAQRAGTSDVDLYLPTGA